MTFWLRGHVTNLKNLYLPLRNIYGLQTWQSSNLRWTDPIFKVMWPFNCMVTWQMKKTYIYTSTIPMAIKLGRVVTYGQKTPHIKSRYFLIKWSREKCKTWYLHFCNIYNHQTWQSGNLHWKDPSFKAMWPFHHVVTWQMNFHNTFSHQTWQSTNLWSEDPTN